MIQETNIIQDFSHFMNEGGPFMWVILNMWLLGVLISFERWISFWRYDVDSENLLVIIKRKVLLGKIKEGIDHCGRGRPIVCKVIKSGLQRANQSKEQIKDVMEATFLYLLPKIEKRMNSLALMANISTLLGLLGTISGLIQSFSAVSKADPASKAELLALGISTAMNTTALGLLCAISLMVLHSFLVSKQNKIISDVEHSTLSLVDLLGTKKKVAPKDNGLNEKA